VKHIAILIPTIDQIGGAERQVLLLAEGLAARGWRVTVVALSGTGSESAEILSRLGIGFVSLKMRRAWVDPIGWVRYRRWFLQNHPDIVHAHLLHAVWFSRWVRLLAPVRVTIDTVHTSKTGGEARRFGYRISDWLATQVTCVSHSAAHNLLAAGMTKPHKLNVLPNGVQAPVEERPIAPKLENRSHDRTQDSRPFPDHSAFAWVAVGRLAPVKDYPTLLPAFARLAGNPRLIIAGIGPDEAALRLLAAQLGLQERVNFAGFQQDVHAVLSQADGFVLSSLWEGLPMSVLEASAAGLPVVATDGAGTREAMIPGETGLIVPVGDSSALAAAMEAIMAMPVQERHQMGARGRKLVEERFALSVVLDQWERFYQDLLNLHPNPARKG
jgi:glycosyltransferase involved in cell wall biosynthesis